MYPTDLTVSAVIELDGKYLLVEERAMNRQVINQPGGHVESGDSPEQAVIRETLEETGCTVTCNDLIGVYLWIHPQTRQQFLRIVYHATFVSYDEHAPIDDVIIRAQWMSLGDIRDRRAELRSPVVLRCVEDYAAGLRQSDNLISAMVPIQQNVHRILATADLV